MLWKWILNIGAVLGGGMWLGRVQAKANRNETDIEKTLAKLDKHTEEAKQSTEAIHALSERIVRLEESNKTRNTKIDAIYEAVKK